MAVDGLTTIPSSFGPKETMDRLEAEIKAKGMAVFARIDDPRWFVSRHGLGAAAAHTADAMEAALSAVVGQATRST